MCRQVIPLFKGMPKVILPMDVYRYLASIVNRGQMPVGVKNSIRTRCSAKRAAHRHV